MKKRLKNNQRMLVDTQTFFQSTPVRTSRKVKTRKNALWGFIKLLFVSTVMLMVGILGFTLTFSTAALKTSEPFVQAWKQIPAALPDDVIIGKHNKILDQNGRVFADLWTEDRVELKSIDDVSLHVIHALVATEDKNFYSHHGIDVMGTLRAALQKRGGGSGLTQQLVKNIQYYDMRGNHKEKATEQSIARKIRELKQAIHLENTLSKDEIILKYLNTVSFGSPSIYGIETAAKYFFDKKAKDLTVAEAAALIGTVQNPVKYNMTKQKNYKKWKDRQEWVLSRMKEETYLNSKEYKKALNDDLEFIMEREYSGSCSSSIYPFYCELVVDHVLTNEEYGATREDREALWARGGLVIKTPLDPVMMNTINNYMETNWGDDNRVIAPTAVVQPGSGYIMGMGVNRAYGNKDKASETTIVLPDRPAAEGSVYKMITLAAALTQGGLKEEDLEFSSFGCPLYPGKNYDAPKGGFKNSNSCGLQGGFMDYKTATAFSSNTWFVTLEMKIGVDKVKEFSKSVGLAAPDSISKRSLSYTLGVVGNSPLKVAAAYATFANQGIYCPPTPVKSVKYADGGNIPLPDEYDPSTNSCRRVMSPKAASIVLKAMRANVSGEVNGAFGIRSNIEGHDNGAKSGTNQNYNSVWAHLTSQYSLLTNVYDKDKTSRGIRNNGFKLRSRGSNTAQTTGSDLMKEIMTSLESKSLDWDNTDDSITPVDIPTREFFTMPSVIGMTPEQALFLLNTMNIKTNISKTLKPTPSNYEKGVIVEQSIPAETKLVKNTGKTITLYIGE